MKSFKIFAMFAMLFVLASCAKKEKPQALVAEAPVEVYQPKHQTTDVNLAAIQKYEYRNAPSTEAAIAVEVKYSKVPYAEPITFKYSYKNGDTYTYVIPKN